MIFKLGISLTLICILVVLGCAEASGDEYTRSNATTSSPKTTPTASPSTPATKAPSLTCEQRNSSCGSCTDNSKCYWCSADSTCNAYPASKIIPRDCKGNKWFWKQCLIPGYVMIIVIPSLCGVILITLGCCIYCCCCRSRGKKGYDREEERIRRRREEAQARNAQKRADRKQRTDAIRQKYGLLNNEDENEVV